MNILVHGAAGHMGRVLCGMVEQSDDMTLAGRVDATGADGTLCSLDLFDGEADCLIDFSHHSATAHMLDWAQAHAMPVVLATTGHTEAERARIQQAAASIPVFFSANMSPAVALLASLARQAARMFPEADIEIVEAHHNRKVDVPSGTALMLADALKHERPAAELHVGRHENGKRSPREIGIHSLRMGNEVGTHEIILATANETIRLTHQAHDRALFAAGALKAARFLAGKPAGLYDMQALLNER